MEQNEGCKLHSSTLATLTTQVTNVCKKIDRVHKENREDHKSILESLDNTNERVDRKLDIGLFKWVISIIIAAVIGLATYSVEINHHVMEDIHNTQTALHNHAPDIKFD